MIRMWINRKGTYPYTDRQTWITRYWLWQRRVATAAPGRPAAPNPRRVAAILSASAERIQGLPEECVKDLHQWLAQDDARRGTFLAVSESGHGPTGR